MTVSVPRHRTADALVDNTFAVGGNIVVAAFVPAFLGPFVVGNIAVAAFVPAFLDPSRELDIEVVVAGVGVADNHNRKELLVGSFQEESFLVIHVVSKFLYYP